MGTERKRKVSLFDVVDETAVAAKAAKSNGVGAMMDNNNNSLINGWNGKPYSQRYYEILEKRKTLPVWHQKEEFLQVLKANQVLVLVGETGSGKTTQVSFHNLSQNDTLSGYKILVSSFLFFVSNVFFGFDLMFF